MFDEILMREKIGWIFFIVILVAIVLVILGGLVKYFILNAKWNKKTVPATFLGCQYFVNRVDTFSKDRGTIVSNPAVANERYVMQFLNEETGDEMRFIVDDTVGRKWVTDGMQKHMPYLGAEETSGTDGKLEQRGLLTYSGTKFISFQKNA